MTKHASPCLPHFHPDPALPLKNFSQLYDLSVLDVKLVAFPKLIKGNAKLADFKVCAKINEYDTCITAAISYYTYF